MQVFIRWILCFLLCSLLVLVITLIIGSVRKVYTGFLPTHSMTVKKCVDFLIIDTQFKINETHEFVQDVKLEEGMSLILYNTSQDDGIYIYLNRQLVRLLPLLSGDCYHICSGLYRQTIYTVPSGDSLGYGIPIYEHGLLNRDTESFIVIADKDEVVGNLPETEFTFTNTSPTHVVTAVNQSPRNVDLFIFDRKIELKQGIQKRFVISRDSIIMLYSTE